MKLPVKAGFTAWPFIVQEITEQLLTDQESKLSDRLWIRFRKELPTLDEI